MNHDERPDLIAASSRTGPSVRATVYPGNGDFTFGAGTVLSLSAPAPNSFFGIAIADLTGDGTLDVAVNATFGQHIDVFENQGSFVFVRKTIPLDHYGGGLAARDLNADGIVDLVAGMGRWDTFLWRDGFLNVLLGTGGGDFAAPVRYPGDCDGRPLERIGNISEGARLTEHPLCDVAPPPARARASVPPFARAIPTAIVGKK